MKSRSLCLGRLLLVAAFGFSSCVIGGFAPTTRHVPFNEADFAGYNRTGSGSVSGQVSTNFDGSHHVAYYTVAWLVPVNPYTNEMVERELGYGTKLTHADPRFKKYARYTKTDDRGHYAFTQVPPGRYYVVGYTAWPSENPDTPSDFQWSVERITLAQGQALKFDVTHNPQIGNSPEQDAWSGD